MNDQVNPTMQPFLNWFAPLANAEDATPADVQRTAADLAEDVGKPARRHAINDAEAVRLQQQLQAWRNNGGM